MLNKLVVVLLFSFGLTIISESLSAATPLGPAYWGNPNQSWGMRRAVTPADLAAIAKFRSGHLTAVFSADFSSQSALEAQWALKSDDNPALKSCRTPASVIAANNYLRLETLIASNHHAQWSTGSIWSNFRRKYGFFEATLQIANGSGLNNAFWLTTDDKFEIDIAEVHYPSTVRMTLHNNNHWTPDPSHAVGFSQKFSDNFSASYHDFGVLWTPTSLVFEVDGQPTAAIDTNDAIKGTADIRLSTALMDYAGKVPVDPVGLDMVVQSVRVFSL